MRNKPMYTKFQLPALIAFRQTLLKFTLLFTHRFFPTNTWTTPDSAFLADIQDRIEARATFWEERTSHSAAIRETLDLSEFPLAPETLTQNRTSLARSIGLPDTGGSTDGTTLPSLMVLLTCFLELTAARMALEEDWHFWEPSKDWRELAGQFMLQAVLEEYLRDGASGSEIFNAAFAFGCPGVPAEDGEPRDIKIMRKVFCKTGEGREDVQMHGWARTRRTWIGHVSNIDGSPSSGISVLIKKQLLPEDGQTAVEAMEAAQASFPCADFEDQILDFLQDMHHGVMKPDVVQVEEEEIVCNGVVLSKEESRVFIKGMELDRDD